MDSDNKNTDLIKSIRDSIPDFDPYFASTQRTKHADFVVVLRKDSQYAVYYFRGGDSGYGTPQEATVVDWLNDGRVQLRGDTLDVSPFQSDEIFLFVWNDTEKRLRFIAHSTDVVK